MSTMKRFLVVGALLGSTLLTGYRVFAGPTEQVVTCAPEQCQVTETCQPAQECLTIEECMKLCGPCDPQQCR